ncbi:unnamed protein product [Mycena citricolor]|uniref:Transmembrane protein n=1 Tax=Mycena citricolor TaxID=2018698 RepID=A0AAD2H6N0_9AGAR|nr:unnamed protein product [Mycena citricolor]
MDSIPFSATPSSRIRERLTRLETAYVDPCRQFLQESYEQHPFSTTSLAIFAASSFGPLVTLLAIGSLAIIALIAVSFVVAGAIVLSSVVLLTTTLASSFITTFLVTKALERLQSARARLATEQPPVETANVAEPEIASPIKPSTATHATLSFIDDLASRLPSLFKERIPFPLRRWPFDRKARFALLIVGGQLFSNIRLPRVLRYTVPYSVLFGSSFFGPRPPFLQRLPGLPFVIIKFTLFRLPMRVVGWKFPLIVAGLYLVAHSKRNRANASRSVQLALQKVRETAKNVCIPEEEEIARALAPLFTALSAALGVVLTNLIPEPAQEPAAPVNEGESVDMLPSVTVPQAEVPEALAGVSEENESRNSGLRARRVQSFGDEE